MISIVFCGRNDRRNGDFEERALRALRWNERLLRERGIAAEWIYVEWNPLPGVPLFAEAVSRVIPDVKVYVVPPETHQAVCSNPRLGMLQFHAKNVGLRRATGRWRLVINADAYLTAELAERLLRADELSEEALYLAYRQDMRPDYLLTPDDSQLETWPLVREIRIDPPEYYGAAGDFMLGSASAVERLGGYHEGIHFSNWHTDVLYCHQALHAGFPVEWLGNLRHVDHADTCFASDGKEKDKSHHHGLFYLRNHVQSPYMNRADWGMKSFAEERDGHGFVWLRCPPGYAARAQSENLPPSLRIVETFMEDLEGSIQSLREQGRSVWIYGFGTEIRDLWEKGKLDGLSVRGCMTDADPARQQTPYPCVKWPDVPLEEQDAILVGSLWWCHDLAGRIKAQGGQDRIYPIGLRNIGKYIP